MTGQPYEAEVRAYLADCHRHRAQLDPAYHPTADGAVKMIPHGGRTEDAGQIRQAFAALAAAPAHRYGHQGQKGKKAPSGLTFGAAALGYIRQGWPVFVLGRSKRPVANCAACRAAGPGHDRAGCGCLTCHGFYAATLDPGRLAAMARKVPGGLLAIRTGGASGLCVVDIDPRNGGQLDRDLMTPDRDRGDRRGRLAPVLPPPRRPHPARAARRGRGRHQGRRRVRRRAAVGPPGHRPAVPVGGRPGRG